MLSPEGSHLKPLRVTPILHNLTKPKYGGIYHD